jgi:hypothetical protein
MKKERERERERERLRRGMRYANTDSGFWDSASRGFMVAWSLRWRRRPRFEFNLLTYPRSSLSLSLSLSLSVSVCLPAFLRLCMWVNLCIEEKVCTMHISITYPRIRTPAHTYARPRTCTRAYWGIARQLNHGVARGWRMEDRCVRCVRGEPSLQVFEEKKLTGRWNALDSFLAVV